jgi:Xaa-Pro aminopeptidase
MNFDSIQSEMQTAGLDGCLFFDHHERDPLAYRLLGLKSSGLISRRWYYFIPARGEPRGLVHQVEPHVLDTLPEPKSLTPAGRNRRPACANCCKRRGRWPCNTRPGAPCPTWPTLDAGTIELIRGLGVEVVSSAELIQILEANWTPAQLEMHLEAGRRIDRIRAEAFEFIQNATRAAIPLNEYGVQQFVMRRFKESGLLTNHPPIVGANVNAADSHHAPRKTAAPPLAAATWSCWISGPN